MYVYASTCMHTSPYHMPISLTRSKARTRYVHKTRVCISLTYMHMSMHSLVYCIHTCLYRLVICKHTGGTQSVQQCLYNACYTDIVRGILCTFLPVLYREIVLSTFTHTSQNSPIPLPSHFSLLTNHAITLIETLIETYLAFPTLSSYTWGIFSTKIRVSIYQHPIFI